MVWNEGICIRLKCALAAEVHEDWLEERRDLNMKALRGTDEGAAAGSGVSELRIFALRG